VTAVMAMNLKDQLSFSSSGGCDSFQVNKMRLNLAKGGYVCVRCSLSLVEHMSSAVTDQDVLGYLAHASGRDGGTRILEANAEHGLQGNVYVGTFAASINPFVSDHAIQVVINCSDLHLSDRSDFHAWALKVEALEKSGVISVLRLNWSDTERQKLWDVEEWDQLIEAIKCVHRARLASKNVVIHCAQGKSRSGAVAIAYIMSINPTMNFESALAFVQSKRAIVEPNPSFAAQLKRFESSEAFMRIRKQIALGELVKH
jgi:protein-tyrosine phosphatase